MNSALQNILLRSLDKNISALQTAATQTPPAKGWLRAIRETCNLSQRDVAEKLGIRQQPYAAVEKREENETVTLATLNKAAGALGCDLVYFLVPKPSVAKTFSELAETFDPTRRHLAAAEHSMALEGQAVGDLPAGKKKFTP